MSVHNFYNHNEVFFVFKVSTLKSWLSDIHCSNPIETLSNPVYRIDTSSDTATYKKSSVALIFCDVIYDLRQKDAVFLEYFNSRVALYLESYTKQGLNLYSKDGKVQKHALKAVEEQVVEDMVTDLLNKADEIRVKVKAAMSHRTSQFENYV